MTATDDVADGANNPIDDAADNATDDDGDDETDNVSDDPADGQADDAADDAVGLDCTPLFRDIHSKARKRSVKNKCEQER